MEKERIYLQTENGTKETYLKVKNRDKARIFT